jgi:hypothetical protein
MVHVRLQQKFFLGDFLTFQKVQRASLFKFNEARSAFDSDLLDFGGFG